MRRRETESPRKGRMLDMLAFVGAVLPWLIAALFRWAAKDQKLR